MTQLPVMPAADTPVVSDTEISGSGEKTGFALLSKDLHDAIVAQGINNATQIQERSLPFSLEGRDILAQSFTGSGKTLAFAIPVAARLKAHRDGVPRALILAPTRELAKQVDSVFHKTFAHLGFRTLCITGGESYARQKGALAKGKDIIIGTPGRIVDLIDQGVLDLSQVEMFVLDEVDQMLDVGFSEALESVRAQLPEKIQTLFFSATLPPPIQRLARKLLVKPAEIVISGAGSERAPIKHCYLEVVGDARVASLVNCLVFHDPSQAIIFCQTKVECGDVCDALLHSGFQAGLLNSDMKQAERTSTLERFRSGRIRFLVATDVASRGIDIQALPLIVNLSVPYNSESYTHRAGRTGRAGTSGAAWTMVSPRDSRIFEQIMRQTGLTPEMVQIPCKSEVLAKLLDRSVGGLESPVEHGFGSKFEKLLVKKLEELDESALRVLLQNSLSRELARRTVFDVEVPQRPVVRLLREAKFEDRKSSSGSRPDAKRSGRPSFGSASKGGFGSAPKGSFGGAPKSAFGSAPKAAGFSAPRQGPSRDVGSRPSFSGKDITGEGTPAKKAYFKGAASAAKPAVARPVDLASIPKKKKDKRF